jgi:hypothetical protein
MSDLRDAGAQEPETPANVDFQRYARLIWAAEKLLAHRDVVALMAGSYPGDDLRVRLHTLADALKAALG